MSTLGLAVAGMAAASGRRRGRALGAGPARGAGPRVSLRDSSTTAWDGAILDLGAGGESERVLPTSCSAVSGQPLLWIRASHTANSLGARDTRPSADLRSSSINVGHGSSSMADNVLLVRERARQRSPRRNAEINR